MTHLIGVECDNYAITLFFRNERGFKFRVPIYSSEIGYGKAKDLYMCSDIPKMTNDEFKLLPDKITVS